MISDNQAFTNVHQNAVYKLECEIETLELKLEKLKELVKYHKDAITHKKNKNTCKNCFYSEYYGKWICDRTSEETNPNNTCEYFSVELKRSGNDDY